MVPHLLPVAGLLTVLLFARNWDTCELNCSRASRQSFLVLFVQFDILTDDFDMCTSPRRYQPVVRKRESDQDEGRCGGYRPS